MGIPENPLAQEESDPLDQEFDGLQEDDFPDLVPADGEGELFQELLFLEESATVELPARHAQHIGKSPSAVTVITREDIQTSGATTVPDLLRMVPGLDVVYASSFHRAVTSRLVWGTMNNTFLLLIDGREGNMELIGQPVWEAQPLFLDDIQRIEVIRGPGSALYGANALAGVVSITTRRIAEGARSRFQLMAGEGEVLQTNAAASFRAGAWGFSIHGGIDRAGTLADPQMPGKEIVRIRAVAERRWSESRRLLLDVGYTDGDGTMSTGAGDNFTSFTFIPIRLFYQDQALEAQLTWTPFLATGRVTGPLTFQGINLATFPPQPTSAHLLDGKLQWALPELWESLLLIVGGRARLNTTSSEIMLDGETFPDLTHPDYHEPGVDYLEIRTGLYLHAEYTPLDWLTLTGGVRADHNTVTGLFLSPRLTAVIEPLDKQFLRLGFSRAFRMPSYFESHMHMDVDFPADSPFQTGAQQNAFREFMARAFGNPGLENEELTALELGYRGEFLDGRLSVDWELYYNVFQNQVFFETGFLFDDLGMPDLERSYSGFVNDPKQDRFVLGSELSLTWKPFRRLALLASWTHREAFELESGAFDPNSPKNLITLGGRYRSGGGFLGSLYLHARSEFTDRWVTNPRGMLEPFVAQHNDNYFLLIGRAGWRFEAGRSRLEAGIRLMLPVSPFSGSLFRYQEKGGGEDPWGNRFGADELRRVILFYLEGAV